MESYYGEGCLVVRDTFAGGRGDLNSVTSSTSVASYWGRKTKQSQEKILQRRVVCPKSKRGPEGSRERDVHHKNATYALSSLFGAAKHFIPKNSEGESESTKYSDI